MKVLAKRCTAQHSTRPSLRALATCIERAFGAFCLALIAFALMFSAQSAHAGYYAVNYSGGTLSKAGYSGPSSQPYAMGTNGYGASGGGIWGAQNGTTWQGGGKCEGEITATFTWQPSGSNDPSPPAVVIAEASNTSFSVNSNQYAPPTAMTCSNGLGFPTVITNHARPGDPNPNKSGTSSGTRYQIKTAPGNSFTLTCSPQAASEGTGTVGPPVGAGSGSATVWYRATASPLQVVLGGGIDTPDGKSFLIGQRVSASLATGGLPASGFNWSVSGGEPFKNWTANTSSTTFAALGTETGSQLNFYFRKPSFSGPAAISCSLHLAVPLGAQPAGGFDVTLSRQSIVDKPSNTLAVYIGTTQGDPNFIVPQGMRLWGAQYKGLVWGIIWAGTVTTPTQYGSGGGWNYTQLITPYRAQLISGVWHGLTINGTKVLDSSFGYAPPYPNLYPDDGSEQVNGDKPASGFVANASYAKVLDSFITYTLYKPPGADSCLVPLKNLKWFWQGEAHPDQSGVWQINPTDSGWEFVSDFPTHPMWQGNWNQWAWNPPLPSP